MREVICINIGQCGIQVSNAAWELFCVEHGIEANGTLRLSLIDDDSTAFKTFFNETKKSHFVPRALTMDLEATVIDEIRKGVYRNLFHPDYLINGIGDGCSNYARGHFTIGRSILGKSVNALRKIVETCDCLQGFFVIHSQGGGTGSGYTSLIMEGITIDFAKQPRYLMSIFPSEILGTSVVEPYNCTISLKDNSDTSDISNIFNNEAIFNICSNLLDVNYPTFSNINRVLSHIFSDITVSLRFESTLNSDLTQLGTNLIPFPKIHFITASHSPLTSQMRAEHEKQNINLLTRDLFRANNQLITCNISKGIYMSCILQYRGEVNPKDVSMILAKMKEKKEMRFVDWCPTGFKLGINCQPPVCVTGSGMYQGNKSATMLVNNGSVKDTIQSLMTKFDKLFSKRSFIHWFVGEGMEEGEFNEAADDILSIVKDYEEITYVEDKAEETIVEENITEEKNLEENNFEENNIEENKVEESDVSYRRVSTLHLQQRPSRFQNE